VGKHIESNDRVPERPPAHSCLEILSGARVVRPEGQTVDVGTFAEGPAARVLGDDGIFRPPCTRRVIISKEGNQGPKTSAPLLHPIGNTRSYKPRIICFATLPRQLRARKTPYKRRVRGLLQRIDRSNYDAASGKK